MDSVSNVSFCANSNPVSQTNLIERFKNSQSFQAAEKDTITLNKDLISDLKFNENKTAIASIVEGTINNKPTMVKGAFKQDECWYEGAIDGQYLLFHEKGKTYDGKYGNEEFRFVVDYNKPNKLVALYNVMIKGQSTIPDYFIVKGKIGDKEINLKLPDIKIPEDEKTKDLLTILLNANGLKAQTINGEIKSLDLSPFALKKARYEHQNRKKIINDDIKPLIMQVVGPVLGMIAGSVGSVIVMKCGFKHHP